MDVTQRLRLIKIKKYKRCVLLVTSHIQNLHDFILALAIFVIKACAKYDGKTREAQ